MIVSEKTKTADRQYIPKPVKIRVKVTELTAYVNPDRVDDFTEELERLCRKYAGDHYALDWTEK